MNVDVATGIGVTGEVATDTGIEVGVGTEVGGAICEAMEVGRFSELSWVDASREDGMTLGWGISRGSA